VGRAGIAGAVAVGVALALAELIASFTPLVPSAIDAVSQQVIPVTPEGVTRWAIRTFGTNDIAVLNGGTTVISLLIGAAAGIAARWRWSAAVATFVIFGCVGLLAAASREEAAFPLVLVTLAVSVAAGVGVLRGLLRLATPRSADAAPAAAPGTVGADVGGVEVARRRFLLGAGGLGVAAVLTAGVGRFLLRDGFAVVDPGEVALPTPARALPAAASTTRNGVEGISSLYTPNDRFYVIDTAVAVPQIDPATWSLRIHGLVDQEIELTYDELLAEPLEEVDATIACVSNEVGGSLVGNARWLGVRLDRLLERAGVQDGGEQVIGRSSDDFTVGFPTELVFDGRDALVAVAMNGEPLPTRHGFPARLIVPGLFGYVSATKWLTEIELTSWDVDAYWVPRGWSKEGPVKTQSRIDVPERGAGVPAGEVVVAGVAWAPRRGIEQVEVRLDGGDWVTADLADAINSDTWVQWSVRVEVGTGDHVVQVRATDGDGETQPEPPVAPAPDGAEGWHRVTFAAT
jgi:DMSO/TMAO reductase YedYZ molybdopterin-dependent catalytic subunit